MSYLLHDRKKEDVVIRKIIGVFILALVAYWLFGTLLASLFYSVEHNIAVAFGYYEDPVRPVSENSLIKDLRRENLELRTILGRPDTEIDGVLSATTSTTTSITGASVKTGVVKLKDAKKINVPDNSRVLGVILARPPRTPYDSLLIDIGEDEGLMPGDVVYAEGNYVIGEIGEVFKDTSVLVLYSAPGQNHDVLLGSSTIPVVAEGRGSGNFYIKVPKNIVVTEGDQIVAPDIKNKIFGTVERVDSGEGDAYSYVYFKLPVNLYALHYVQIKKSTR